MATSAEESFQELLDKASDKINQQTDCHVIYAVCQKVTTMAKPEEIQKALMLFVGHMQSPIEIESVNAMTTLEACVGFSDNVAFNNQVGGLMFINELRRLVVSQSTSSAVKQKVVDMLYNWSRNVKDCPTFEQAYAKLKRRGFLATAEKPQPGPKELEVKEIKVLPTLLQNTNWDDNQAANPSCEKIMHNEIFDYLKSIGFKGSLEFDLDAKSSSLIHSIVGRIQRKDTQVKTLIRESEKRIVEYESESRRLEAITKPLDLSPEMLSEVGRSSSHALGEIAASLGGTTAVKPSVLEMGNLVRSELKLELQLQEQLDKNTDLRDDVTHDLLQCVKNERMLENLKAKLEGELPRHNREKDFAKFLTAKRGDYERKIERLQAGLEKTGYRPTLSHNYLEKSSRTLERLQVEAETVTKKLTDYENLPMDQELASVKLAEAKLHLRDLEREIEKEMNAALFN